MRSQRLDPRPFRPRPEPVEGRTDHVLDRWLTSITGRLIAEVTDAYENFDLQRVGQSITTFVDDLSNWYVRRSRRRFWKGDRAR